MPKPGLLGVLAFMRMRALPRLNSSFSLWAAKSQQYPRLQEHAEHILRSVIRFSCKRGLQAGGWPQADERIRGLLWPLLAHVTGPAGAEGGALMEEALRLLSAALAACPELPPELAVRRPVPAPAPAVLLSQLEKIMRSAFVGAMTRLKCAGAHQSYTEMAGL